MKTDLDGAQIFAERLRSMIENSSIYFGEKQIQLTVSIGFACFDEKFDRYEKWVEAADKALYHSKENGRNKVTAYSDL